MKFAANNSHGVNEREPIRVFIRLEGRFMHQAPDGEVGHQEAVELLAHQVRPLAAQNDASSPQVGFQFIQGRLNLPAFVVQGGQFKGRLLFRNDDEKGRAKKWGITDLNRKYSMLDMAKGDVMFAATGVTSGSMLKGVRRFHNGAETHSIVMRSKTGTVRVINATHHFSTKPRSSWATGLD